MIVGEEVVITHGRRNRPDARKGIHATVLDVLGDVVMVLPWNSGREAIFLRKNLRRTGRVSKTGFE